MVASFLDIADCYIIALAGPALRPTFLDAIGTKTHLNVLEIAKKLWLSLRTSPIIQIDKENWENRFVSPIISCVLPIATNLRSIVFIGISEVNIRTWFAEPNGKLRKLDLRGVETFREFCSLGELAPGLEEVALSRSAKIEEWRIPNLRVFVQDLEYGKYYNPPEGGTIERVHYSGGGSNGTFACVPCEVKTTGVSLNSWAHPLDIAANIWSGISSFSISATSFTSRQVGILSDELTGLRELRVYEAFVPNCFLLGRGKLRHFLVDQAKPHLSTRDIGLELKAHSHNLLDVGLILHHGIKTSDIKTFLPHLWGIVSLTLGSLGWGKGEKNPFRKFFRRLHFLKNLTVDFDAKDEKRTIELTETNWRKWRSVGRRKSRNGAFRT